MYYNTKASGARIRELRLAKKLDQIELAELPNVSHGYISFIESGKRGCSDDLMIQIFEIFGTSLDYLILGKCHDVLDAAHLKENIQHLMKTWSTSKRCHQFQDLFQVLQEQTAV